MLKDDNSRGGRFEVSILSPPNSNQLTSVSDEINILQNAHKNEDINGNGNK